MNTTFRKPFVTRYKGGEILRWARQIELFAFSWREFFSGTSNLKTKWSVIVLTWVFLRRNDWQSHPPDRICSSGYRSRRILAVHCCGLDPYAVEQIRPFHVSKSGTLIINTRCQTCYTWCSFSATCPQQSFVNLQLCQHYNNTMPEYVLYLGVQRTKFTE
jgi:hypothetical protein